MRRILFAGLGALVWTLPVVAAAGITMQTFTNVTVVSHANNDGDSFKVRLQGTNCTIRLYFVDCPESSVGMDAQIRRIREQTRYFGLKDSRRTLRFGKTAAAHVQRTLSKPFTVHTAYARAPGGRFYGFVSTASGKDLGSLLVASGWARCRGIGRRTPGGIVQQEMRQRLEDMQDAAMLKRVGVWKESDSDRIAELRAEQRLEEAELAKERHELEHIDGPGLGGKLDLNSISKQQLTDVKGIGETLADRIIAARPFRSVDELLKVKGIGEKTLAKLRGHFLVAARSRQTPRTNKGAKSETKE